MPGLPEFIAKEADAADALAEAYREDILLVLLGPAEERAPARKVGAHACD